LHENDKRLLLLDDSKKSVYCMDLNRGEVIEEWECTNMLIRNINPLAKYAQRTEESMFAAVNNNTVFTIDPRVNQADKLAQKQIYTSAPGLTCVATTGAGRLAVGSAKGEIRLFSEVDKRAKNLLPGLGDAIVSMDVTEDGRWVLATCKTYLLLISTSIESDSKGRTQFEAANAKDRSKPIKLQIDKKDLIKYNIGEVSFTAAHFNTGDNIDESWIVTSTGPYVVTWNFNRLKSSGGSSYEIKLTTQEVVAEQFRFGMDNEVVIATEQSVYKAKRGISTNSTTSE